MAKWWARWSNTPSELLVIALWYVALTVLMLAGLAANWLGHGDIGVYFIVGVVILLTPTIIVGAVQRLLPPVVWLTRLIWRKRRQPAWALGAPVAFVAWLALCAALWRLSVPGAVLFAGFSLTSLWEIQKNHRNIGAWLREVTSRVTRRV